MPVNDFKEGFNEGQYKTRSEFLKYLSCQLIDIPEKELNAIAVILDIMNEVIEDIELKTEDYDNLDD